MGAPVGAEGGNRLEQLYRMSATRPMGAPTTPTTPTTPTRDDVVMRIVLTTADVFNSIQYANSVFATRYFGEDGYGAIERLCKSLQALNDWCQENSQACEHHTVLLTTTKDSITAMLRRFLDRVSYWSIEDSDGMTDVEMGKKIADMCDHLKELHDTCQRPPMLSRQRAYVRPPHGAPSD